MLKARLQDGTPTGTPILAKHHTPAPSGPKLLCADFNCNAEMFFCHASKVRGDRETRQSHFSSKPTAVHSPECRAHLDTVARERDHQTIKAALKKGGRVIINLNLGLKEKYSAAASKADGKASINGQQSIDIAVSAKNIEDIVGYIETIQSEVGTAGLWSRTIINHDGKTMGVRDFVVDTPAKYLSLLEELKKKTDTANFPRLMYFKPTGNTHTGASNWLQGTPVDYLKDIDRGVVLLERACVPPKFEKALRALPLNIVAIPTISDNEIRRAEDSFVRGSKRKEFIHIYWQIHGPHQFTPA